MFSLGRGKGRLGNRVKYKGWGGFAWREHTVEERAWCLELGDLPLMGKLVEWYDGWF